MRPNQVYRLERERKIATIVVLQPQDVVTRFDACINAQDADGLGKLMTVDHAFIDTAGARQHGKAECLDSWRGFLNSFPDYRNTFTEMRSEADVVTVLGYATCVNELLDGPALWTARVRDDKVAEWRMYDDWPSNRARLGL
jgi:ketosteroid isomerase-like protein